MDVITLTSFYAIVGFLLASYSVVGNDSVQTLGTFIASNSQRFKSLVSLDLSKNNITDVGAKALAKSQNLKGLRTLNLNFNRIGDEGAK